jgi:hypothetical protein
MKKRRLLLLVGIGVVVAAGLTALLLCPAPTMINPGNAARVGEGMEFATVECLLGPPRDEFTGRLTTDNNDAAGEPRVAVWRAYVSNSINQRAQDWSSDQVIIHVEFDDAGRVERVETLRVRRVPEWPWDRLRRWMWR